MDVPISRTKRVCIARRKRRRRRFMCIAGCLRAVYDDRPEWAGYKNTRDRIIRNQGVIFRSSGPLTSQSKLKLNVFPRGPPNYVSRRDGRLGNAFFFFFYCLLKGHPQPSAAIPIYPYTKASDKSFHFLIASAPETVFFLEFSGAAAKQPPIRVGKTAGALHVPRN